MNIFELKEVYAGYNDNLVLKGVNLEVPEGVLVLLGPSGSGKSTLLRLLNRLMDPTKGLIFFKGKALTEYPVRQLRRKVGMVFQQPVLFEGTVEYNIKLANSKLERDQIKRLLTEVMLPEDYIDRNADELSVGEAQRVCLARTLATEPEVLLLDEPTSALDPTATKTVERLLLKLSSKIPLIWVTHLIEQAKRIGHRTVILIDGKIHWIGDPQELETADDETVRKFAAGELK